MYKKQKGFIQHQIFSKKKLGVGFTLIEIVITLAILGLLAAVSLPFTIDFYRRYFVTFETRTLVSILRRAENLAMSNNFENKFGVSIQPEHIVIFKGIDFNNRDLIYDETYERNESININGLNEIVFSPVSGKPIQSGSFTLSEGQASRTIDVNSEGALNW
ncbi:MAG: prepilin-type N-terminal cleavage/methylation domain-containing protein [Candidatus Paceibacterota bacterium]|jgi:prepilin-type N-terminal cleavage/methylation domain-containing protein